MIVHCLSPNPKCTSNSNCHHQIKRCNCSSGCICLTNYCSPCSNKKNLKIDVEPKKEIKQRVTYEIDSKENFSPIPPLKKNQSMLYQNISQVIPLKDTVKTILYNKTKIKLYIVFIFFNNLSKNVKSYIELLLIIGSFLKRISIKYSFEVISISSSFSILRKAISIIFLLNVTFNIIRKSNIMSEKSEKFSFLIITNNFGMKFEL